MKTLALLSFAAAAFAAHDSLQKVAVTADGQCFDAENKNMLAQAERHAERMRFDAPSIFTRADIPAEAEKPAEEKPKKLTKGEEAAANAAASKEPTE